MEPTAAQSIYRKIERLNYADKEKRLTDYNNEVEEINKLIKKLGEDEINELIKDGYMNETTLLHFAAVNGYVDIVKVLLEKGADVNAKNNYRHTPLHSAVINGNVNVVNALLGEKADVKAVDKNGDTPLHFAAINRHIEIIKTLLENGADVDAKNKDGSTLLNLTNNKDTKRILIGVVAAHYLIRAILDDNNAKNNFKSLLEDNPDISLTIDGTKYNKGNIISIKLDDVINKIKGQLPKNFDKVVNKEKVETINDKVLNGVDPVIELKNGDKVIIGAGKGTQDFNTFLTNLQQFFTKKKKLMKKMQNQY